MNDLKAIRREANCWGTDTHKSKVLHQAADHIEELQAQLAEREGYLIARTKQVEELEAQVAIEKESGDVARRGLEKVTEMNEQLEAQVKKRYTFFDGDFVSLKDYKQLEAQLESTINRAMENQDKLKAQVEGVRNEIPCLPHEYDCVSYVGGKCQCPVSDIKAALEVNDE